MSKVSEGDELNFKKQDIIRGLASQGYIIDSETRKQIEGLPKSKIDLLGASIEAGYSARGLAGRFETEVLPESPGLAARLTVLKAIKSMKESGIDVSESQAKMIVDKLSPALEELDPEYLKRNSEVIAGQIQKEVLEKSMVTSSALGGLYIREKNLDKISMELESYLDASDKFQISKIQQTIFLLGADKIAESVGTLLVERARATKYDLSSMNQEDVARMRRENRAQFDQIVFDRRESTDAIVVQGPDDVIDKVISKLMSSSGVKLSQDQQRDLRGKLQEKLEPALSKLEPEYLQTNGDKIASQIQKELYKDRSIAYRVGLTSFSVSDKSLDNISKGINANHQLQSDVLESVIVNNGLEQFKGKGQVLEAQLTALAVEKATKNAAEKDFIRHEMTPELLLQMRKEDPKMFDTVVLNKKEKTAAKGYVVSPEQEKAIQQGSERIKREEAAKKEAAVAKKELAQLEPPAFLSSLSHNVQIREKLVEEQQVAGKKAAEARAESARQESDAFILDLLNQPMATLDDLPKGRKAGNFSPPSTPGAGQSRTGGNGNLSR